MNIYYSNFTNVDLKHGTSEGTDFSFEEEAKNRFVQNYEILTESSQKSNMDLINDDFLLQTFDFFTPNSRSKTDNPTILHSLHNEITKIDKDHSVKII
jgi:hypothetical protein